MGTQEKTRSDLLTGIDLRQRFDQEKRAKNEQEQEELNRKKSDEKREKQEQVQRQERHDQMSATLQTFQLSLMKDMITKPAGNLFV